MSLFSDIVRKYPDSLEARIIQYLQPYRPQLQRVSSELRASANLPPQCLQGKNSLEQLSLYESQLGFNYRKKLPYFVCFSLACLSWWIDEEGEMGKVIRFLLEEEVDRFPDLGQELQVVLHSKAECLLFLQERYYHHNYQTIFSSIITLKWSWIDPHTGGNISRSYFDLAPRTRWVKKLKPKKKQRIRGYRDHGSLGDHSKRVRETEWKKDYLNREEEEQILDNRRTRESLFKLLLGWFQ